MSCQTQRLHSKGSLDQQISPFTSSTVLLFWGSGWVVGREDVEQYFFTLYPSSWWKVWGCSAK